MGGTFLEIFDVTGITKLSFFASTHCDAGKSIDLNIKEDCGDEMEVVITEDDIRYLVSYLNTFLEGKK